MSKKQIHTLLVILAVLIGGILIRQQQVHRGVVTEDYQNLDFSFAASQAERIVVSRAGKAEITAVKKAGQWRLQELWDAAANSEKIEKFLNDIASARGELRADDASLLKDFGIDDGEALGVQISDGKGASLADLRVGIKRAGPGSVFVRRASSVSVYITNLDLFRELGFYGDETSQPLEARLWADLEPLQLEAEDLTSIEGRRWSGGKPVTVMQLKKEAGEKKAWTFSTDYSRFVLNAAEVDVFLRAISRLRAANIADPSGDYGFETPALQLRLQEAGKTVVLTVGREDTEQKIRYLRVEGDATVYEITRFTFEELLADDSRFFKAGLPGLDQAVIESVTLTKAGQAKQLLPADSNAFESVLQTLRSMEYAGLLAGEEEKKKARSPGLDTVVVEVKTGDKIILDLGEKMEGVLGQEGARYAAQLRSNPVLFTISESDYTNLFESFKQPPPAETKTSQPALNEAE